MLIKSSFEDISFECAWNGCLPQQAGLGIEGITMTSEEPVEVNWFA
jgi:hypothetical protein